MDKWPRYMKNILALSALFFFLAARSQQVPFPYNQIERLTMENGLSHNNVYDILRDKNGFMWILTLNGLDRYDGYSCKHYAYPGFFFKLEEDSRGFLWLCDENAGVSSFNPVTGKFTQYRHLAGNSNSISDDRCFSVLPDKNFVWIPTHNGLDKLDLSTGAFIHYKHNPNTTSIRSNFVTSCCLDENGKVWVTTDEPGIDCLDPSTGNVQHYDFGSKSSMTSDATSGIYGVKKGKNGNLWIAGRENTFFCYNTRTGKCQQFYFPGTMSVKGKGQATCFLTEDTKGNLWFMSETGGLCHFDPRSGAYSILDEVKSLNTPLGVPINFFEDNNREMWMATEYGVFIVHNGTENFVSYSHGSNPSSLSSDVIWSFLQDTKRNIYVGSENVDLFDAKTNSFSKINIASGGREKGNYVWMMYEDDKHILWFATMNGLVSYDPFTKKYAWYVYDPADSTSVSAQSVTGIIQDANGKYWCTTWGGGLNEFNPATGKFRSLKKDGRKNSLSTNSLSMMMLDAKGILYMGGWKGGLILFDPATKQFKSYLHDEDDPESISSDIVTGFVPGKDGIVWVTTNGGGLNAFQPSSGKFRSFTVKDGLRSDGLSGILEDNGDFWITCSKGIIRFSPPKKPFDQSATFNFRNYDVSDGVPSNNSFCFALLKDKDGKIFVGTQDKGFYTFKPASLTHNSFVPPVYVSGINIYNKPVIAFASDSILKEPVEHARHLDLDYRQNEISFEFTALNYDHPEKNQYEYMLEGYDITWIRTDAKKRYAYYTNLEPAEYVFKVRGSNNDGIWNMSPATLSISISPPFWKTGWFRILVALAVVGAAYAFYRYRIGQVLLLQRIRNKIAADLHDDIGSTLNSISIYSGLAKKDPSQTQSALDMIGESSRKVIESMSDIVWSINPENDSFDKIILRMRSLSYHLLNATQIEFTFRADESLDQVKLPMEKRRNFYLIFKEVLNNLVKYSRASRASVLLTCDERFVTCIIRDDGVGFDTSLQFNGNGLNNIRKRATEMNAQLHIESAIGKGTNIELNLKL